MPVTARLVNRYGSAAVTRISTFAFCLALPVPGIVPKGWMLAPALFVFGYAAGSMEISMNTQAVTVEHSMGRPVMTTFHAMFSLGGMTGAGMSGLAASRGLAPATHLSLIALPLLLASVFATGKLLKDPPHETLSEPLHWTQHVGALWTLGAIAFCVLVGEGAMADWTTVYLHGIPGVSPALAVAGYAMFSVCMAMGRFRGDWFRARFDETTIIRSGAAIACLGLAAGLLLGGFTGGLIGFACAGFGFSSIFPILTLKSGQVPGVRPEAGIALVTATGYAGFLVGPPLIGFAAQISSLRVALGLIPLLSGCAVLLAGGMPESARKQSETQRH
jgi:fucose permease